MWNKIGSSAYVYQLLSKAFLSSAGESLLLEMGKMDWTQVKGMESDNTGDMRKGEALLNPLLRRYKDMSIPDRKQFMLDLRQEWVSLFERGEHAVPMTESVYLAPENMDPDSPRRLVAAIYRQYQFEPARELQPAEDHIAHELAFMSHQGKPAMREEFHRTHLARWIPQFSHFLIKAARGRLFYTSLAHLVRGIIQQKIYE